MTFFELGDTPKVEKNIPLNLWLDWLEAHLLVPITPQLQDTGTFSYHTTPSFRIPMCIPDFRELVTSRKILPMNKVIFFNNSNMSTSKTSPAMYQLLSHLLGPKLERNPVFGPHTGTRLKIKSLIGIQLDQGCTTS